MSAVPRVAFRSTKHVKVTKAPVQQAPQYQQQQQPFRPQQLLSIRYEPFPQPINCATLVPTQRMAEDPSHPLYVRTRRRLAAFQPQMLHWRVQCPKVVSNKSFIRNWAAKRVKHAFSRALADGGWQPDGSRIECADSARSQDDAEEKLGGALLIVLLKDQLALTASQEEVRMSASWVLARVLARRNKAVVTRSPKSELSIRKPHALGSSVAGTPEAADQCRRTIRNELTVGPDDIRKQVEYYFSDANLPTDRFMLGLVRGVENKSVSLRVIHQFKKMRKFRSYEQVRDAVKQSTFVEILNADEGEVVRRRVPLDARFTDNVEENRRIMREREVDPIAAQSTSVLAS